MYPFRIFLCLATVMIFQQSGVAPPVPVQDLDSFIKVNTTVLDMFIQKKVNEAFNGDQPFHSTSGADIVGAVIKRMFANQPLIKIFSIGVDDKRVVTLNSKLFESNTTMIANISLVNPYLPSTSSNNLLAYRPRYNDWHKSNLAAIFINAKELTCGSRMCKIMTDEEDGFNKGKAVIEAGDGGNSFRIFNSTEKVPTYGFAIQDCPVMNTNCLPNWYSFNIVCYVPRDCVS